MCIDQWENVSSVVEPDVTSAIYRDYTWDAGDPST